MGSKCIFGFFSVHHACIISWLHLFNRSFPIFVWSIHITRLAYLLLTFQITKRGGGVTIVNNIMWESTTRRPRGLQLWEHTRPDLTVSQHVSGGFGDSGTASPFMSQPTPIFFLVILLPLLRPAALLELSPHKLPLECQRWRNNERCMVA